MTNTTKEQAALRLTTLDLSDESIPIEQKAEALRMAIQDSAGVNLTQDELYLRGAIIALYGRSRPYSDGPHQEKEGDRMLLSEITLLTGIPEEKLARLFCVNHGDVFMNDTGYGLCIEWDGK